MAWPRAIDEPTTATSCFETTASVPSGSAAPAEMRAASPCVTRPARRRRFTDDRQAHRLHLRLGGVFRSDRETVDRRRRLRGQIFGRGDRFGEDATVRFGYRQLERIERRDLVEDAVPAFGH